MDPYDYIIAGRYQEAVDIYSKRINESSVPDRYDLAGRATAYMCLDKYDEAISDYEKSDIIWRTGFSASGGMLEHVAITLWIKGEKEKAITKVRSVIDKLVKGEIIYSDFAGGVGPGLLLWYMSVSLRNLNQKTYAIKYLDRLTKKSRIVNWPGPIAQFVLVKMTFEDVINATSSSFKLPKAIKKAKKNILLRRELCQAFFYFGVKKLDEGDCEGFIKGITTCFELENPLIEHEWYLAKYELTKNVQGGN